MEAEVRFFASRARLRAWFERNHATSREVWIGFFKAHVAARGPQYLDAVEEALCFGWIDTTVRRVDASRYAHRFTPRREGSRWSDANRIRFEALEKSGRVAPSGRRAYERRTPDDPRRYSYEQGTPRLSRPMAEAFHRNPKAWSFFEGEPPSYQRLATHWVMSAVREETRARRFAELLDASSRSTRPRGFLVEREVRRAAGYGSRSIARNASNERSRRREKRSAGSR